MINPAEKVGLKWAAKISQAYQDWADQESKSRTIKIKPFDPEPQIKLAFYDAGEGQLNEIGKLIGAGVKFDLRSKEAESWISDYGASEVKYINSATRQAIRQISLRSLQDGLTPAETSKEIKKIIGLLPQHAIAVRNYYEQLIIAGTDENVAANMEAKYADRLLRYRADTIGLTESHTATNHGALQATKDAIDNGVLQEGEYQLEWLYTNDDRTCDECTELDGETIDIGDTFSNGLECPPAHQRCRCTTIIVKSS